MIKLICVTDKNNNKYYYMEDLNNGTFKATYGRVGATESTVTYPMSQWNKKYNEKIIRYSRSRCKRLNFIFNE